MKTFRTRVTVLCAAAIFALSASVVLVLVAYTFSNVYLDEQHELAELAERVNNVLGTIEAAHEGSFLIEAEAALASEVNEKISFLFEEEDFNISYAIYDLQGTRLYEFTRAEISPLPDSPEYAQSVYIEFESYKDWTFFRRVQGQSYQALVSSSHHFDFIDHLLIALAVLLPSALALSLLLGVAISRKVVAPIQAIGETARKIEEGNLSARIPSPSTGDEVEQLVKTLNATFDELEASFARVSQFSADVAHELRTPLTAMRGNLEVCLRRSRSQEEYEETIAASVEEASRLGLVIDSLLKLAQEPGEWDRDSMEELQLHQALAHPLEQCRAMAEDAGITLVGELAEGLTIKGAPGFLQQLIYNLVQNAIRHSTAGDSIRVTLVREGHHALLAVHDEGEGIAPEHLDKIFDRFYQVDPSRRHGTGLGLALARWITDMHGGEITVQSKLGKGTSFTVCLPLAS